MIQHAILPNIRPQASLNVVRGKLHHSSGCTGNAHEVLTVRKSARGICGIVDTKYNVGTFESFDQSQSSNPSTKPLALRLPIQNPVSYRGQPMTTHQSGEVAAASSLALPLTRKAFTQTPHIYFPFMIVFRVILFSIIIKTKRIRVAASYQSSFAKQNRILEGSVFDGPHLTPPKCPPLPPA
jgi:hypothetical protein